MKKSPLELVAPTTVFGKVQSTPPRRQRNKARRSREYLTEAEVERLIKAAGDNRYGFRDGLMVLIAFRHGLRSAELVTLRWDQVDLEQGFPHISRRKNGTPAVHPLSAREQRALRRLKREQEITSPFVFTTERKTPLSTRNYRYLIAKLGFAAGFDFPVSSHMLRHACGFRLANAGVDTRALQAYLGHRNIQHTVRYTELSPNRFRNFWND